MVDKMPLCVVFCFLVLLILGVPVQIARNIQNAFDLTPREWAMLVGERIHLGVGVGQITNDAVFKGLVSGEELLVLNKNTRDDVPIPLDVRHEAEKIRIELGGKTEDILWGDIFELWPL